MKANEKSLEDYLGCEYFFLNGEKMDISFNNLKPPSPIPLSFIREQIKDQVPEDFIFLNNIGEDIKKEDEEKIFTSVDGSSESYYIYSEILLSQRNYEPKNIILDLKKLEEKEEFIIYEYPIQEIKENEEFYSIILFGSYKENFNFINVFINYLYDIQKEDNFRLKIENKEKDDSNNKNEFLKIIDVKHEKGNFKFYSFNFGVNNIINLEEINQLDKVFINKGEDIHIDFIVYNKIDYSYEDKFTNKIFTNRIDKIGQKLTESKFKGKNSNYFFTGPNMIFSDFIRHLRLWTIDYYGRNRPTNAYDKSREDLKNFYALYYCFCDYEKIYETKNDKFGKCTFNQLMDGFSKIYTALMNAPKNYQYKKEREIFTSLLQLFERMGKKYNEFITAKKDFESNKQKKLNLVSNQVQLAKVMKQLQFIYKRNNELKDFLMDNKKKITPDCQFLIPYKNEPGEIIEERENKTTVCKLCLHNCHIHCKDLIKNFCKAFDLKFNCKVCPNRCPASSHEVVKYEYPKYEYKTYKQIFPNNETKVASNMVDDAYYSLYKENFELEKKISYIKKDLEEIKGKIDNITIDMKKLNDDLNNEISRFLTLFVYDFNVKGYYEEEIFKLFMFSFLKMDYIYEYTQLYKE